MHVQGNYWNDDSDTDATDAADLAQQPESADEHVRISNSTVTLRTAISEIRDKTNNLESILKNNLLVGSLYGS